VIRRVAFAKAGLAGAAGAIAWEVVARALLAAGLPLFDLVRVLGTLVAGDGPAWRWWPAGLAVHVAVGIVWAVFYAYFVWSILDRPPAVQGAAFSLGPALLAGLVMVPQLDAMHPLILAGEMPRLGVFGAGWGWGGPAGIVAGHLAYGAVLGGLYTRPVGRPVRLRWAGHG
jgi:hypothetical protein